MKSKEKLKSSLLATGLIGVCLISSSASAYSDYLEVKNLIPLERLSPQDRVIARNHINTFLIYNPQINLEHSMFALDQNGAVYVLDKNLATSFLLDDVAEPSTIGK